MRNPPEIMLNHNASFSTFKNFVVIHIGRMRNKKSANPTEINIVKISASLPCFLLGTSDGAAISADHCNVEYPNFIASNKEAAPLKTGFFQKEDFSDRRKRFPFDEDFSFRIPHCCRHSAGNTHHHAFDHSLPSHKNRRLHDN